MWLSCLALARGDPGGGSFFTGCFFTAEAPLPKYKFPADLPKSYRQFPRIPGRHPSKSPDLSLHPSTASADYRYPVECPANRHPCVSRQRETSTLLSAVPVPPAGLLVYGRRDGLSVLLWRLPALQVHRILVFHVLPSPPFPDGLRWEESWL